MTTQNQIYRCTVCGNIVQVLHAGAGQLVCCNQPMQLQTENTTDAAAEKHISIIEKTGNQIKITVGSTLHPMETDHHIEWIEIIADEKVYRQNLQPGQEPTAQFEIKENIQSLTARAYCNLHGLWQA